MSFVTGHHHLDALEDHAQSECFMVLFLKLNFATSMVTFFSICELARNNIINFVFYRQNSYNDKWWTADHRKKMLVLKWELCSLIWGNQILNNCKIYPEMSETFNPISDLC